ncbi:putative TonB-dependent receptor [Tenacibaculum sp. 190524A02b]|uniref:TonB-dependent receptor n=1 Tax=Tenacibaculum vairaonense TaxID=3137860 RepID=A0ABM9PGV1_9FLAO
MRKHVWLLVLFTISFVNAQEETTNKAKDTIIKTEVVKVVTSYVPKITDAFKIKQKPTITHSKDTEKKKLDYQIISVPVASTFIPKSGAMKKIDLGKRERLYDNYVSAGFGMQIAPFLEGFYRRNLSHDSELGVYANFILSLDPVQNTQLSSTFYNMDVDISYKQVERLYTWEAGLNLERNKYSWYGLPTNIDFRESVISSIDPSQTFGFYNIYGNVAFDDSLINTIDGSAYFFSDAFSSSEVNIDANANFIFPLDRIHRDMNDLSLTLSTYYLAGKFAFSYEAPTEIKYSFFNLGLHPTYKFAVRDLAVKLGAKAYLGLDLENSLTNLLVYPDVEISYPIVKDFVDIYIGASGDLENNSFRKFTEENPFVSPSLNITQTNTKYSAFGGLRGKLGQQFSYNVKGSYADIEDYALHTLNYSKSDGNRGTGNNGFFLYGYEYGNSFRVLYDDTKLISVFGEVAFEGIKDLIVGGNVTFNKFTLENELQPWNIPQIKGELFGSYKVDKWYAGANIFFVGERKGVQYAGTDVAPFDVINLDSYIDINLNGGYHFHDDFSVFLNLKNIMNTNYQRYTNYNVQGFQAMAGLTWKFDSMF